MEDEYRLKNHRWIHYDMNETIENLQNQTQQSINFANIDENAHAVIVAAIRTEDLFIKIIESYVRCTDKERQSYLHNELLQTSWCTFSIKRDLALNIIKKKTSINGKDYDILSKQIAKLMRYRNAFAHGRYYIKDGKPCIEYYSGKRRYDELNREFWISFDNDIDGLMNALLGAWAQLRESPS